MFEHQIQLIADIEGVHQFLARFHRLIVHNVHDGLHTILERRMRWVGHQFVVFDEIDARFRQNRNQIGRLRRRQSDARFDDGANDRPALYPG